MRNKSPAEIAKELYNSATQGALDLTALAHLGHLAPSIHNVQPWALTIDQKLQLIEVRPSVERHLKHSDPAWRQTWISIGALVQNILSVAAGLPLSVSVNFDNEVAKLSFKPRKQNGSKVSLTTIIAAILARHNNRADYLPKKLAKSTLNTLREDLINNGSVQTNFIVNTSTINKLAELSGNATRLAFSSRDLRHELAKHINRPYRPRPLGIPARALSKSLAGAFLERPVSKSSRFLNLNAGKERRRMQQSSALALIFTKGDTKQDWLLAGQEYEKLCLKATGLGLAHSTSAALVEAPDYYKEVSNLLDNSMRLQAVIRLGYAKSSRGLSGRLPLEAVLHVTDNPR